MSAAIPIAPKAERCAAEFVEKPGLTHRCKGYRHHDHQHICICSKTWRVTR